MQKQLGGGASLFPLTPGSPSYREVRVRTQGRNLEAGADVETWKNSYWLAHGLLSLLSYVPQDYLPRGSTTLSRLGPPISISN